MYVLKAPNASGFPGFHEQIQLIFQRGKIDGCFIENCIFKS